VFAVRLDETVLATMVERAVDGPPEASQGRCIDVRNDTCTCGKQEVRCDTTAPMLVCFTARNGLTT